MEKVKEIIKKVKSWIGEDGAKHFLVSFLLLVALGWVRPIWVAVCVVLAIGQAKEVYDIIRKGVKAWKDSAHDLACDIAGIALGVLFVFLNSLAR